MAVDKCDTPMRPGELEPRAGDKVQVQFTGIYSHQGSGFGSSGCHVVEVGLSDKGRRQQCSVPPDADIWVLERKPLEPVSSVVVMERSTGRTWWNDWQSLYPCRWKESTTEPGLLHRFTWQEILDQTNGGQGLKVFRYESSAECYKGPVRG